MVVTRYFFVGLLILITSTFSYAQGIVVKYETTYVIPDNDKMSKKLVAKMNTFQRPRIYSYLNGVSVYKWLGINSPLVEVDGRKFSAAQNRLPVFYKDFSAGRLYVVDMKNDSTTAAVAKLDGFNSWKILRYNKVILGHLCRKAVMTTKKGAVVEAWFATDIDILDGPETYFGLPGLILEVKKGIEITRAVKIEFKEPDPRDMAIPDFSNRISYEKYLQNRRYYGRGVKH
ncbi:MAG TPA: GLPGLI family protein [Bacteroidetes bacterium]|nr:GLPGLI family protein [Bacteroidota bacterium]